MPIRRGHIGHLARGADHDRPTRRMLGDNILYVVCRVKAGDLSGCDSRPANWSLQPVAIGAIEEVTNRLKPSTHTVALGDHASMQAVT